MLNIQNIKFENDPINLNNKNAPSIQGLKKLKNLDQDDSFSVSVLLPNQEAASKFAEKQKENSEIEKIELINSYIPREQRKKMALIEELNIVFGGEIESKQQRPINLKFYNDQIALFLKDFKPTTKEENRLIENIRTLMGEIEQLEEQEKN